MYYGLVKTVKKNYDKGLKSDIKKIKYNVQHQIFKIIAMKVKVIISRALSQNSLFVNQYREFLFSPSKSDCQQHFFVCRHIPLIRELYVLMNNLKIILKPLICKF